MANSQDSGFISVTSQEQASQQLVIDSQNDKNVIDNPVILPASQPGSPSILRENIVEVPHQDVKDGSDDTFPTEDEKLLYIKLTDCVEKSADVVKRQRLDSDGTEDSGESPTQLEMMLKNYFINSLLAKNYTLPEEIDSYEKLIPLIDVQFHQVSCAYWRVYLKKQTKETREALTDILIHFYRDQDVKTAPIFTFLSISNDVISLRAYSKGIDDIAKNYIKLN
jgi:hypothetical protein